MATNCVRQRTVCRTEVVINTTRNHISAEHDILLSQNYYFTPNPVPIQYHDLISIQKALELFPCTDTKLLGMDIVLKKQTTSIFRTPPEDTNSNLL